MNRSRRFARIAFTALLAALVPALVLAQTPAQAPEPDVLVVGGTPAGVAAALAAARRGETVVLVAAGTDLGGVLTGAMMDQWDLNLAPDGAPVERGIFAEIQARLGDAFAPETAARALAAMAAAEPRIVVRYDETPISAATSDAPDGKRISLVDFRNARSGAIETIAAEAIVDATDNADVAALAGARYDLGRQDSGLDERMQAVTEMFAVAGIDWRRLSETYDAARFGPGGVVDRRAWGYSGILRDYRTASNDVLVRDLNLGLMPGGSVTVNAVDVLGIDGLDSRARAAARSACEREAPRLVAFLRTRLPGFEDASVGRFAPDLYVRETRHVAGLARLTADDVWDGRIPADSIGLSSYPLDLHPVEATDRSAYAPLRHVYGVPFGALVPEGFANLVLAGPAISASHLAAGSARVVPTTIEEGEAAGAASAVARRRHVDFHELATSPQDIVALRRDLAADGVIVGEPPGRRETSASPRRIALR